MLYKIKFPEKTQFLFFEFLSMIEDFLNHIFLYDVIPLTNKPTRVTRHSGNVIDHINTNRVIGHIMTLRQPQ